MLPFDRLQRRAVQRTIGDIDQPRPQQADDCLEFAVVFGQEGIGGGDGSDRHADMLGRQCEQRVLDAVVREDGDRPVGRKAVAKEPRRNAPDQVAGCRIRGALPPTAGPALLEECPLRRRAGPVLQVLPHDVGVLAECLRGSKQDAVVTPAFDRDRCRREKPRGVAQ